MWNTFWKQLITVDKNLNIELYNLNYKVPHSVIRAALGHGIAEKHDTAALQKLLAGRAGLLLVSVGIWAGHISRWHRTSFSHLIPVDWL